MDTSIITFWEIVAAGLQFITGILFLHSMIHLLRVWREMSKADFFWLITPIAVCTGLAFYNVADPIYVMQRFPLNIVAGAGMAWSFYRLSRKAKEDLFSIQNVMKRETTSVEKKILDLLDKGDTEEGSSCVSKLSLELLEKNIPHYPSKRTYIMILNVPSGLGKLAFIIPFEMLVKGEFTPQYHPKLREEIHVTRGCMYNASTGIKYYAGDVIHIPAGEDHHIIAHDRASGVSYLFDV